jgi:putative toxin-antitoxin system antitoxin component (TIGR02293 family)
MVAAERVAEVMGGSRVLGKRIRSIHQLEETVLHGIPKRALRHTAERIFATPGAVNDMVFRIVPEATFKRRARLSPAESARTERLARVIAAAEYIWDNRGTAREWLTKPHPELRGRTPLEAAMSELGARQAEELLQRLFYGIPA